METDNANLGQKDNTVKKKTAFSNKKIARNGPFIKI